MPTKEKESPRRYLESDVNIHYRCPVRRDPLPLVPERELERQQADHMRRLYREQRRAKYLQASTVRLVHHFRSFLKVKRARRPLESRRSTPAMDNRDHGSH
ncbi:hypothetical protein EVAR_44407_1 [Eumeta japonica]|uniref:Uncharacterized protein n=1 Tax=Eumeta variegata TaxID=151549 RepID=A0A4C1XRZ7_EUMVA|nr:hypothetical protein EVAR_44407_1 [Eumeta japonica]